MRGDIARLGGAGLLLAAALFCTAGSSVSALALAGNTQTTTSHALHPRLSPANATRPPMGFNTWNAFGCDIDEPKLLQNADLMVSRGYVAAGYVYFNIDDCWMADTRANGELVPDKKRFPRGIKYIADYLHARGMKLGIYSSAGTGTCMNRPGSLGYEEIDARTFAKWGVDLLKYDNCNNNGLPPKPRFKAMADALKKHAPQERPIMYAMCAWGDYQEWKWAYTLADTWRITHDICRSWSACAEPWFKSVTSIIDAASSLSSYQGPRKGWNDADMLQVGNPGLSKAEGKAHFGMWAGLKSPLIIGTDLRTIDAYHEEILLNSEVIAVNQDTKGRMATRVSRDAVGREIWAGPLSSPGRSCVVILLNRADSSKYFSFDFGLLASALGLSKAQIKARKFKIRDLFKKQDVAKAWPGKTAYSGAGKVEAHGIVMLKITQV